jgi:hypothetical protein
MLRTLWLTVSASAMGVVVAIAFVNAHTAADSSPESASSSRSASRSYTTSSSAAIPTANAACPSFLQGFVWFSAEMGN